MTSLGGKITPLFYILGSSVITILVHKTCLYSFRLHCLFIEQGVDASQANLLKRPCFPMNNHLRYMQFLCMTYFFINNDVTLRRNDAIILIIYGFLKSCYPKVVIVTTIRLNRNILLNNFENICLVCILKVSDFVMFDKHF